MAVSAATETKLREAMARLLAGAPLHTDGALTKENLAREAQVSHASVHRADAVLAEWDARVARPVLRSAGEARRDETIAELERKLREANRRATELQGKLDALASVTTNLYHENRQLRSRLEPGRGTLTVLPSQRAHEP
jgi:predicted RNase H-like nuclease (RuvC/YqgF family)